MLSLHLKFTICEIIFSSCLKPFLFTNSSFLLLRVHMFASILDGSFSATSDIWLYLHHCNNILHYCNRILQIMKIFSFCLWTPTLNFLNSETNCLFRCSPSMTKTSPSNIHLITCSELTGNALTSSQRILGLRGSVSKVATDTWGSQVNHPHSSQVRLRYENTFLISSAVSSRSCCNITPLN